MLVCDGISEGNFPNPEVVKLIAEKLKPGEDGGPVDPRDAAIAVCRMALAQGSKDNLSCMIVTLGDCKTEVDKKGFIPGPYVPDASNFMKAYEAMAGHAGLSLEQAVELRYRNVCSDLKDLENSPDSSAQGSRTDESKEALLQEKLSYGDGPGSECAESSEESINWFKDFIEQALASSSAAPGGEMEEQQRQLLQHMQLMGGGLGGLGAPQVDSPVIRKAKVCADQEELKRAMEEHAALKWDDRLADACGRVGGVITDDDSDGTSQVKFSPPLGFKAWLPTNMLEDVTDVES